MITTKKMLIEALRHQIATRDAQALKALVAVYNNQTVDEQDNEDVYVHNGIGFTPNDAEFMSSLAKQYLKKNYLSSKQMSYVKKTMPKYAGQLIEQSLAQGKIVKDGKNYTWEKPKSVEKDTWTESHERHWVEYKNKYAKLEAEQEAAAFRSKMEYEMFLNGGM